MSTTWVDVTTILQWQRSAVGVVRCELEVAKYALNLREIGLYKFCRYSKHDNRYIEVAVEEVERAIARINGTSSHPSTGEQASSSLVASPVIPNRLDRIALKAINFVPVRYRQSFFNFAAARREATHSLVLATKSFASAIGPFFRPNRDRELGLGLKQDQPKATNLHFVTLFTKGDTYLSLGLDWDQKDFAKLYSLKKEYGFRVVLFAYDVIPVLYPHLCVSDVAAYFARYFADLAWCADRVLCISKTTERDLTALLNELGVPCPETKVITLGSDIDAQTEDHANFEIADSIGGPYILYVSTIERRKNHEVLYRAYSRLIDKGIEDLPKLVFVGMQGWGVENLMSDIRLDPRVQGKIEILNNVSDNALRGLYLKCVFTLFPSIYEGWGLPVAESLAQDKFCIASKEASIPEVGGDLLEYCDPWQVNEWADAISKYYKDQELLGTKENAIRDGYLPTTWEKSAGEILEKLGEGIAL